MTPTPEPPLPAVSASPEALVGFCVHAAEALDAADLALIAWEYDQERQDLPTLLKETYESLRARSMALGLEGVASVGRLSHGVVTAWNDLRLPLSGGVMDTLYESVACLRGFLVGVYAHLEGGEPLAATTPRCERVARSLRSILDGEPAVDAPLPPVEPGQRVGEILVSTFDVPESAIERALQGQVRSGRRLGEELVASHLVEASVVARALRAQALVARNSDAGALAETVKVDLRRLDGLMEALGELVVVESTMRNVGEFRQAQSEAARRCLSQLAKITRELTDAGTRLRLHPAHELFSRVLRTVRETGRRTGRSVTLDLQGQATEVDRLVVEQLTEPVLALVRAAVAYGVEPRDERERIHKPSRGTVQLRARTEAGNVVLEISDDGAGIEREALLRAVGERGLALPPGARDWPLETLLCHPGVWPPPGDPDGAGALLPLDQVKARVTALRGRMTVQSTPGQGTTFQLVLPLTLTTLDAMLVACGRERFLIPTLSVVESIRPTAGMVATQAGRTEVLSLRGSVLPLVRLSKVLEVEGARGEPTDALVVVVELEGARLGLLVDDVVAQQHVVIKPLGEGMGRLAHYSGAGIHGDGQIGLILDVRALFKDRRGSP
ncbi:MAG: chemotaxis protein CheW [Anaeromyxobacter sp.]